MIQCYHLLHELAYELAPVTPCFAVLVCVGFFGFVLFGDLFLVGVWFLFCLVVTSSRPSGLLTAHF